MQNKTFQINLDLSLASKLRNKINEKQEISIKKTLTDPQQKVFDEKAWHRICAIMDRIDDISFYLNSLIIKQDEHSKLEMFKFYNFLDQSAVLLECIEVLGKIYSFDFRAIDERFNIFNNQGSDGKGTDKTYFKYIRSICSVHPIMTNKEKSYIESGTRSECSPFCVWTDNGISWDAEESDLYCLVYTNSTYNKHINIKLDELFSYVKYRYSIIELLISHINTFNKSVEEKYRKVHIRTLKECSSYNEYLGVLKDEYERRVSSGWDSVFEFYIYALQADFKEPQNHTALVKFQNSIKYTCSFLHKYLQDLPEEEAFENTGIKTKEENVTGDHIFFHLFSLPEFNDYELWQKYHYPFEKLTGLFSSDRDDFWKESLYREVKDYVTPFVSIDFKTMDNKQIALLIYISIYFINLKEDTVLSENIPDTDEYRL